MKKTRISQIHESLGAKMVDFAGYHMPLSYTTIIEEHNTVRNGVGIFDVSHMGEFLVRGEKAIEFLQVITSNDISKMNNWQAQYTCLPNREGGIVDDLIIYKVSDIEFLVIPNAANIEKDWQWFVDNNKVGAELQNISDNVSQFAIQGPKSIELLQELTEINLSEINYYHFTKGSIAGIKEVIISATGYTGEKGFELYCNNSDAEKLWNKIFEVGTKYDLKPIGLAARDTLRLEKGYCLYGNDIDGTTSPIEAGLGWITKFSEGNNFINRDNLEAQKREGVEKKLVAFTIEDKGIPRKGYCIVDKNKNKIGEVTSGTMSPILGKGIGLAYIKTEFSKIDTDILIQVRKKELKAKVVKLPFV
jgi:aminomethyltransferase